jgi:hypothetical protein
MFLIIKKATATRSLPKPTMLYFRVGDYSVGKCTNINSDKIQSKYMIVSKQPFASFEWAAIALLVFLIGRSRTNNDVVDEQVTGRKRECKHEHRPPEEQIEPYCI